MLTILANVLLPVFGLIALGWWLGRVGVLSAAGGADMGRLLYWVCLPAQLLLLASRVDLRQAIDGAALVGVLVGLVAGLVLGWWLSARLSPDQRGSVLNGAARSNGAFIGLPVVDLAARALAPAQHDALLGTYAVLLGPSVIAFNIASVVAFLLPHHGLRWSGVRESIAELPRSPLIIACAGGALLGVCQPGGLDASPVGPLVALPAAAAIPLALIGAGRDLDLSHLRDHPRVVGGTVVLKLLVVPAITWGACRLLGAGAASAFAATVLMGCPVAIASVPMARMLGGNPGLMATLVAASTIGAPLTLFAWLVVVGPR